MVTTSRTMTAPRKSMRAAEKQGCTTKFKNDCKSIVHLYHQVFILPCERQGQAFLQYSQPVRQ